METAQTDKTINWKNTVWCAWDRETLSYVVSNDGVTWVAISEEDYKEKFTISHTTTDAESQAWDMANTK
jgi:hypothetical protein